MRLALFVLCSFAAAAEPLASPARNVAAYVDWLHGCVRKLQSDVPAMAASAEDAAAHFVRDGWALGAWGDEAFVSEVSGRAGGIMPLATPDTRAERTIVLLAPRDDRLTEDLDRARAFAEGGNLVVLFGRKSVLDAARVAGVHTIASVDTHAADHGGLLLSGDERWLIPTDPPARYAAVWAWTAEFVAACTRLGKMPVMWQSIMVPGSADRNRRVAGMRFDDGSPRPAKPGALAREYLRKLDENVKAVFDSRRPAILLAAERARAVRAKGGKLYAYLFGHATMLQPGSLGDPMLFTRINREWNRADPAIEVAPGDFVLGIGYDTLLRGETFGGFAESVRKAGCAAAWSFTDYKPEEVSAVLPGEVYIDQGWPIGDAVVSVPGYDVRILPTSGVISCGLYWAIQAGVVEDARPARRPS